MNQSLKQVWMGWKKTSILSVFEAFFWFNESICDANRQVLERRKAKNQVAFQRKKCYNILLLIDMFMKNDVKYIH